MTEEAQAEGADQLSATSLRRRVAVSSFLVFLLVMVAVSGFVIVLLDQQLEQTVRDGLAAREQVAASLASRTDSPKALAEALAATGIPAVVRDADGTIVGDQGTTTDGVPAVVANVSAPRVSERLTFVDGTVVTVYASRAGADAVMRRVLILLVLGSLAGAVLGGLALRRAAGVALGPLDEIVLAVRTARAGNLRKRLRPDRVDTEVGRLAAAYDEMLDDLEAAIGELQTSNTRSRRFLSDAAHQLRTPVAAIRSTVEALLRTEDPDDQQEMMGHLLRETGRASRVVASLLRVARMDQRREPARHRVNLATLIDREVERARSRAPGLDIRFDRADELPDLQLDEESIAEAVSNLLDNARRHAQRRVDVSLVREEGSVMLVVQDDGAGVPAGSEEVVFERFASLDGRGGSGLGLPIARGAARSHGGDLVYRSGAFVLHLPLEVDASRATPAS